MTPGDRGSAASPRGGALPGESDEIGEREAGGTREELAPRHWIHLLALAVHRLAAENEEVPDGPETDATEATTLPLPPRREFWTEEDLLMALEAFGPGPVPASFGLGGRRLELRPARLLLLLKLCRSIGSVERLEAILRLGALTIVQGRAALRDLEWVLQKALVPDRQVVRDGPSGDPHALHLGEVEEPGKEHSRYTHQDPFRILEATAPILLLLHPGQRLPPQLEIFGPPVLELGVLDVELLLAILELYYPGLTAEEVTRLGQEIAGIDLFGFEEVAILGLFRLPSAADVTAALRKAGTAGAVGEIALRDLVGLGPARDVAVQLLEDMALWQRGELAWSAVCRGLLLVGPPGTGKTLLARAMAQEAGLTFVSCSYAQWQRLGNLNHFLRGMADDFGTAIAGRPALLFIDEIDAFYTRQELEGGRNDSYDIKAITGLLEHLDGFAGREGAALLAATNHLEQVDPAITRAGRFDRIVSIGLPDQAALQVILRQHLGGALPEADLFSLAGLALGKTGADIAAAVRMAGAAARRDRRAMGEADLVAALLGEAGPESVTCRLRRSRGSGLAMQPLLKSRSAREGIGSVSNRSWIKRGIRPALDPSWLGAVIYRWSDVAGFLSETGNPASVPDGNGQVGIPWETAVFVNPMCHFLLRQEHDLNNIKFLR